MLRLKHQVPIELGMLERLHFEGGYENKKTAKPLRLRGFYAGATDPIRTDDLLITSELLYLLSHSSTLPAYYSKQVAIRQEGISTFFTESVRLKRSRVKSLLV